MAELPMLNAVGGATSGTAAVTGFGLATGFGRSNTGATNLICGTTITGFGTTTLGGAIFLIGCAFGGCGLNGTIGGASIGVDQYFVATSNFWGNSRGSAIRKVRAKP